MLIKILKLSALFFILNIATGCGGSSSNNADSNESVPVNNVPIVNEIPVVKADSTYFVWGEEDLIYAEGLSNDASVLTPFAIPLKLDVYYPEDNATNRPAFLFIHGGGFTGGTKTKPEIIDMANYFASRGWVFISIDYRTAEEIVTIEGLSQEELLTFYRGIAPEEWIDFTLQGAATPKEFEQSLAMYMAQRDAKAALRWIVANSDTYFINTDFITVGGASAGAITAITLGVSDQEDFRDEITLTDDPTLSTTNLDEAFEVKSIVNYWGSNVKLELFESIYGLYPYDINDPELFTAHGTNDQNPSTLFTEATELEAIYDSIGLYNELVPLEGEGHGAWAATVDGKTLSEISFDFIVNRQNLTVE